MNLVEIRSRLFEVPLFKELSQDEIEPIIKIAQSRLYKPKMLVFMQEDPLDRVFFIHTGRVKIYKTDYAGREQIVSILEAGEMFPHAGFFRQGKYPAYAEVMEETNLIIIPIADFEKILISYPELCIKLFKVLGEKIVDLQNRLEEQILHNTYEQIIMLLLRLCKTNGTKVNSSFKLLTHFTNKELANMIGTSRETVSRTMNYLKKKSYIEADEDGLYFIHHELLHKELF